MSTKTAPVKRTLFNVDALFELICGLIFLFNPLLGPKLPVAAGLVSALGFVLLVAAILLGQAGMGKGSLQNKLPAVAAFNVGSGVAGIVWTLVADSFTSTAKTFVWIVAALLIALGGAQLMLGNRPPKDKQRRSTQSQRLEAIRKAQQK